MIYQNFKIPIFFFDSFVVDHPVTIVNVNMNTRY